MTTLGDVEREIWRLTGWRDEPWTGELMSVVAAYGQSERMAGVPPLTWVNKHGVPLTILSQDEQTDGGNSPDGLGASEKGAEGMPGAAEGLAVGVGNPGSGLGNPENGDVIPEGHKRCTGCDAVKPLDEFWKSKGNKDGRMSRCAVCSRKQRVKPAGGRRVGPVAGGW